MALCVSSATAEERAAHSGPSRTRPGMAKKMSRYSKSPCRSRSSQSPGCSRGRLSGKVRRTPLWQPVSRTTARTTSPTTLTGEHPVALAALLAQRRRERTHNVDSLTRLENVRLSSRVNARAHSGGTLGSGGNWGSDVHRNRTFLLLLKTGECSFSAAMVSLHCRHTTCTFFPGFAPLTAARKQKQKKMSKKTKLLKEFRHLYAHVVRDNTGPV
ncbi:hypothetical protein EYF80_012199 [Liparis tanakae]|uniref:Uncharacterized protein n=1 Tax=Liparis tanakae TaxID=230148 RepID=A0A4Z2IHW8_9TELE|nr:hypothetical protein EYF80_012199 [Liparis tanakae]